MPVRVITAVVRFIVFGILSDRVGGCNKNTINLAGCKSNFHTLKQTIMFIRWRISGGFGHKNLLSDGKNRYNTFIFHCSYRKIERGVFLGNRGVKYIKLAYQWACEIVQRLRDHGFEAYFVGGCVRDMLMGRRPADYDIATDATVDQVRGLFRRTVPVGAAFGVVMVLRDNLQCQVSTYRGQPATAQEDACLRDFTINALFYDPVTDTVHDWVGGRADIENKIIRAVGSAQERFADDYLRMLRAVRICTSLGFAIDSEALATIRLNADRLAEVSKERIRDELIRIFSNANAATALELLRETGLFKTMFPDLFGLYEQRLPEMKATPFELISAILRHIDEPHYHTGMAALLSLPSLLRYPSCVDQPPDGEDSELVSSTLRSYMFSNADRKAVCAVLFNHRSFIFAGCMPDGAKKTFMRSRWFTRELAFHRAHLTALGMDISSYSHLSSYYSSLTRDDLFPPALITGKDLYDAGFTQGPHWRAILSEAQYMQLDGSLLSRQDAISWLHAKKDSFEATS